MFSETGFLCLCCKRPSLTHVGIRAHCVHPVLVAVWRSSRSAAAQGRMSLVLSQDGDRMTPAPLNNAEARQAPRGWWDYVPETAGAPQMQQRDTLQPPVSAVNDRFTQPPPLNGLRRTASHNSNTPILRQHDDDYSPTAVTGWRSRVSRAFSRFSVSARHSDLGYRRSSSPTYQEPQLPDNAAPPSREKSQKHLTNSTVNSTTTFLRRHRASLAAPGGYGQTVDLDDNRWRKRLPNMIRVVIRDEVGASFPRK